MLFTKLILGLRPKKELDYATGIDTSDLATKKAFIALKAEFDKIGINPFVRIVVPQQTNLF